MTINNGLFIYLSYKYQYPDVDIIRRMFYHKKYQHI